MSQPSGIQFDQAEYDQPPPGSVTCADCRQEIPQTYYQANDRVVCERCMARLRWDQQGGSGVGRFLRAAAFGAVAALLGTALYYAVLALTGYEVGLIAIVVGFMVGVGVRIGSRGRGGWKYQTLAVALTYLSIVSSYIPMIVSEIRKLAPEEQASEASQDPAEGVTAAAGAEPSAERVDASLATAPDSTPDEAPVSVGGGIAALLLAGVFLVALAAVAPFLGGFSNILGLAIIGIGLYQAWKLNRRTELTISGPFRIGERKSGA